MQFWMPLISNHCRELGGGRSILLSYEDKYHENYILSRHVCQVLPAFDTAFVLAAEYLLKKKFFRPLTASDMDPIFHFQLSNPDK